MTALATVSIAPDDLLDAAKTIPLGDISRCDWLVSWVPATTLLEWAQRGIAEKDAYGLSNAVTYAKRSATSRIDLLLQYNHLVPFSRSKYPTRIDALRRIGVSMPDVVHELVIDPRNTVEHRYQVPSEGVARHAVGVAELFIHATHEEYQKSSIVAVSWNAMGSHLFKSGQEYVSFREFADRPMLFIDVIDEPRAAKIVDPRNGEIRSAPLRLFSEDESLALAQILRSNYSQANLSGRGISLMYLREMKRQGGF
jgi:hypothetical protein